MKVRLGKFGRFSLERQLAMDPAVCIQAALLHYTLRLRSGTKPVAPPRFLPDLGSFGRPPAIELSVAPELEAALKLEARRHDVSLDRVLQHALYVFIADLDAASEAGARQRLG